MQLIFCYSFQRTECIVGQNVGIVLESDSEGHILSEVTGNFGMSDKIVVCAKIVHLIILQIPSFGFSTD